MECLIGWMEVLWVRGLSRVEIENENENEFELEIEFEIKWLQI